MQSTRSDSTGTVYTPGNDPYTAFMSRTGDAEGPFLDRLVTADSDLAFDGCSYHIQVSFNSFFSDQRENLEEIEDEDPWQDIEKIFTGSSEPDEVYTRVYNFCQPFLTPGDLSGEDLDVFVTAIRRKAATAFALWRRTNFIAVKTASTSMAEWQSRLNSQGDFGYPRESVPWLSEDEKKMIEGCLPDGVLQLMDDEYEVYMRGHRLAFAGGSEAEAQNQARDREVIETAWRVLSSETATKHPLEPPFAIVRAI